jgi:hypothetical protein
MHYNLGNWQCFEITHVRGKGDQGEDPLEQNMHSALSQDKISEEETAEQQ